VSRCIMSTRPCSRAVASCTLSSSRPRVTRLDLGVRLRAGVRVRVRVRVGVRVGVRLRS
jgi:hypothetical protein